MRQITITEISGATYPVSVYISDVYGNNKFFLGVINSSVPPYVNYNVEIPAIFNTAPQVMLTMVDSTDLEFIKILNCIFVVTITPTPTPTLTPGLPPTTPTPTPSVTKTPGLSPTPTTSVTQTQTPTITPSITQLPTYKAYIFAEPQNSTLDLELLSFANSQGADSWYSWFGNGVPNNNSGNYSNDLNIYAHQPNFISGSTLNIQPQTLSSNIAQYQGQIINGLSQNLYTFGSIEINLNSLQRNTLYFYSIWIPLDGVGGTMSAITIDVGTSIGGTEVYDAIPALSQTISYNVNVTAGAAIPEGIYRVVWISPQLQLPALLPLNVILYFRGDTKF
jgi:hypothetical protein